MNNIDSHLTLLHSICESHQSWSDEELDNKLKEYYKSIPPNILISSTRLNEIIRNRFQEGLHHKTYVIKANEQH
jgi:hypothetical protein